MRVESDSKVEPPQTQSVMTDNPTPQQSQEELPLVIIPLPE